MIEDFPGLKAAFLPKIIRFRNDGHEKTCNRHNSFNILLQESRNLNW